MSSLLNFETLVGIAKGKAEFLSKTAENLLGIKIPPQEMKNYISKAESLVSNNRHKLKNKNGLKRFLKNDVGATDDDLKRVSKVASKYTNKVPFGKDAINILDDMIDSKSQYQDGSNNNYFVPAKNADSDDNRRRETYFNADRYRIKK